MRIAELGDCSMVIMKDSEDQWFESVGEIYRSAKELNCQIRVKKRLENGLVIFMTSCDYVCTAGKLILFFNKEILDDFKQHDRVTIRLW